MAPNQVNRRKSSEGRESRRGASGQRQRSKPGTRRRPRIARSRPSLAPTVSGESGERLQKVLAAAGVASRRECELLILEGRVEVDRQVVRELGTRVDRAKHEIRVDGDVLHHAKLVYFAVNKPVGVVSTARDQAGRQRVIDLLPPNSPRVFSVGRLDMSSEGLILVTNDGELANGLAHPRHGVEKIYHVQVSGEVGTDLIGKLQRGVRLADGFVHAKHVRIKSRHKKSSLLEMVLDEGRNREIRRLLAKLGHKVQRLRRVAVGPVRLGEMPAGSVRELTRQEVALLKRAVSVGRVAAQGVPVGESGKQNVVSGKLARPAKRTRRRAPDSTKRTIL